jgi:hypothetical protein
MLASKTQRDIYVSVYVPLRLQQAAEETAQAGSPAPKHAACFDQFPNLQKLDRCPRQARDKHAEQQLAEQASVSALGGQAARRAPRSF